MLLLGLLLLLLLVLLPQLLVLLLLLPLIVLQLLRLLPLLVLLPLLMLLLLGLLSGEHGYGCVGWHGMPHLRLLHVLGGEAGGVEHRLRRPLALLLREVARDSVHDHAFLPIA